MNTLRSFSLLRSLSVASAVCRRRRRQSRLFARRGRRREHELGRRLSADRETSRSRSSGCSERWRRIRVSSMRTRRSRSHTIKPAASRRRRLTIARDAARPENPAPRTRTPCSSAAGRTVGPMPSRISAARPPMPIYATPEVAMTNAGVCARSAGDDAAPKRVSARRSPATRLTPTRC